MADAAASRARRRADPTERLLGQTGRRLFAVAFALVAALVVGIGTISAVTGLAALDADVDHSLADTVAAAALHPSFEASGGDTDDVTPAAADTFVLYLDASGVLVSNPSHVNLPGLPVREAVAAVGAGGQADWRTISAGGVPVRLLTEAIPSSEERGRARYVQGGFVLTLHDQQSRSLITAVAGTALAGLLAAAVVTFLVTRRSLGPIRRAIESQRRFVADASHELRTPAAVIRADAEVLQREGLIASDGAQLLDDIVEESGRLGRLVGELLTLSTAQGPGLELHRERLDVAEVTRSTARRISPLGEARGVTVQVTAEGRCEISGDRDRIVQAIVVLLDNAIRHTAAGSPVEVSVRGDPAGVRVSVRDHGPGVPEADRRRIFEPFTRASAGAPAGQAGPRGSGLGLSIAQGIVAAHGGSIEVGAAPGGGAVFEVRLPRA